MKISVILAHPNPDSFNHAITRETVRALGENGHEVLFRDLYRESFDPVIKGMELAEDTAADELTALHCNESIDLVEMRLRLLWSQGCLPPDVPGHHRQHSGGTQRLVGRG